VLTIALALLATSCAVVGERGSVANAWQGYGDPAKLMFVVGFNNGWKMGVVSMSVAADAAREETQQLTARFDAVTPTRLTGLMDAFYADPANQFVSLDFALDLVVDQAAGVDIEPALGKAREIGLKNYRAQSRSSR